jgi:hypothetical protein
VANTRFNGDGVVPLAATDDEQLHKKYQTLL